MQAPLRGLLVPQQMIPVGQRRHSLALYSVADFFLLSFSCKSPVTSVPVHECQMLSYANISELCCRVDCGCFCLKSGTLLASDLIPVTDFFSFFFLSFLSFFFSFLQKKIVELLYRKVCLSCRTFFDDLKCLFQKIKKAHHQTNLKH